MKTLNKKTEGTELYEIEYTPKGKTQKETVTVWAKNRLDASNYMILNKLWGKQHRVTYHTSNFLK
jgi:hypothetical protein